MRELLERIGGWRGRWGVGLYGPHELLVSLARLEGKAALGQGGEGAGGTLCLSLSKPEQSQGHLRGGARVRGAEPGAWPDPERHQLRPGWSRLGGLAGQWEVAEGLSLPLA